MPSNDELRFLPADTEEAKNCLLDSREMAESARDRAAAAKEAAKRTRREQQGWWSVFASLRLLRSVDPSRTSLHGLVLGPSRLQRRRQVTSDFEPTQKSG